MSEKLEGSVTKKISQEFCRTESRIVSALSKLDEFLQNPQVRVQSGTVAGTSCSMDVEDQEQAELRSQIDPRPEVNVSVYQPAHPMDSETEETSYYYVIAI